MTSTSASLFLTCDMSAPERARAWAGEQLTSAATSREISSGLIEDALLCISELVTNAIQALCDATTVELILSRSRVRVAVTDDSNGWPTVQRPGPDQAHGRGLMIVSALAQRWGVDAAAATKTVWAELACDG